MSAKSLYPLKFKFIPKDKVWGGTRLREMLHKSIDSDFCGESWEISGIGEDVSVVECGDLQGMKITELLQNYKGELVGNHVYQRYGNTFPLLVKFIDANRDLSIQVHPNDEQAKIKHNSLGKNEMWYVLHAEEGAKLIAGFDKKVDRASFIKSLENDEIESLLHEEKVKKGDVFYMPAGRIHNVGSGMLIAEIQQASDITYRIHDYNRTDLSGGKRELHIDEALEVLDFEPIKDSKTHYEPALNELISLVKSSFFTVNKLNFDTLTLRDFSNTDSFVIYVCLEGKIDLTADSFSATLKKGDVYLIPACIKAVSLMPIEQSLLLEAYID